MAHEHEVQDMDGGFFIDAITRKIENQTGKTTLMQHDHNSERIGFAVPLLVEGHNMSECNSIQIHYQNKDAETGTVFEDVYEVTDISKALSADPKVVFSWLISGNATQYAGSLSFSVRFACIADDGTIEYAWNTDVYDGITVRPCFFNSESIPATFSDVLAQWYKDLYLASVGEGVTVEEVRNMLGAVAVKTASVTLTSSGWSSGSQTVNVAGVTADSATCHVFATYSPASFEAYRDSEVRCVAQGDGTLTFACNTTFVPTADININVSIYYGEG